MRNGRHIVLLGGDFLSQFDIEIDLKGGVVNFFKPQGCEDSKLIYWADAYNVADMVKPSNDSRSILVRAKINDHEITAQIDSGASLSSLSREAAASTSGIDPDSPGVQTVDSVSGVGGTREPAWLASFPSFTLDKETIKPAKLIFFRYGKFSAEVGSRFDSDTDNVMILGSDFLLAHRALISYSQRKFYFTYVGGPPFQARSAGTAPAPEKLQP